MADRPKRKAIPIAVKRIVIARQDGICKCGCSAVMALHYQECHPHFDHEPALRLRAVNGAGTDYEPPQLDPRYIDARCPESHHAKTHGTGATTAGTDIGKIKKERKRSKATKPTRKIHSPGFAKIRRPMRSANRWPKRSV